jgi:hypothetical protein
MHIFSSANAPNCGRCCDTRLGGFQQPKILGSFTCLARGGSKMNHSEFESAISRREDRAHQTTPVNWIPRDRLFLILRCKDQITEAAFSTRYNYLGSRTVGFSCVSMTKIQSNRCGRRQWMSAPLLLQTPWLSFSPCRTMESCRLGLRAAMMQKSKKRVSLLVLYQK